MKQLIFEELVNMSGSKVIVKDLIHGYSNQECEVNLSYKDCPHCGNSLTIVTLENKDFEFGYDEFGDCTEGEFEVYTME